MATELLETLKEDIKHDDKDPLFDFKTMFEEDLESLKNAISDSAKEETPAMQSWSYIRM